MSVFIWQVFDRERWSPIAMKVIAQPDTPPMPLVTGDEALARVMQPMAEMHHTATGLPVRLARYDDPTIMESWI